MTDADNRSMDEIIPIPKAQNERIICNGGVIRNAKGQIQPGSPPVPGVGRPPKDIRLRAAACDASALKTIIELITAANSDAVRLAAARELLDRAHGRPKQTIVNEVSEEDLEQMFSRMGQAIRQVLIPAVGAKDANKLMGAIKQKYEDLREGEADDE